MKKEVYELKKSEYFKDNEDIFIQMSDNVDFNGVTHSHYFIELIYVISGSATHKVENTSYTVKKGNLIMIDYQVPHSFTFDPLDDDGFVTYDLLFTPDFFNISALKNNEFYSLTSSYLFSSIFTEFNIGSIPQNLIKTNSKEFCSLFEKIYQEFTSRGKGYQSIIRAYLIELIIKIFREIDKHQPAFTETHQELVQKAIEYMQTNYKSPINLDEVISGIFLSKNYFRQIFKKTTGISISSYMQELRISEACRLLEATVESSTEIAYKCGFNDTKFFYQTFKKVIGMTPAEYRREKCIAAAQAAATGRQDKVNTGERKQ